MDVNNKLEDAARGRLALCTSLATRRIEIARKLGVSRQWRNVWWRQRCRGLIKVRLNPIAKCMELASRLTDQFGLIHAARSCQ
jgi:DNA-binding transcriptional regulator LsrR (DeoR family)